MADAGSASGMGSGGMVSKIAAARIAASAGASLAIVSGRINRPLSTPARHTLFAAESGASARKAWLAGGLTAAGRLSVDAGAARALASGASLLAAGVTAVEGRFERGDVLDISGPDGRVIARGLAEYPADDAAKLIGLSREAQEAVLGYAPRSAVVHRDHLVLL
jgi:glutamate 5-kinase